MIKNSKKGFTLVELLAVMSVLAIIALIAVPVVTDTIRKAKDKASLVNAELYLKAAHEAILEYKLEDEDRFYPETCTVNGKDLICDNVTIAVKAKGNPPDKGTIVYENEEIVYVLFKYGKKIIINNFDGILVSTDSESIEKLGGICTYDSSNEIVEKTAGAKYSCEVKPGTYYNFYVLTTPEKGSATINLIMDRNICKDGAPATENNNCTVAYNSSGTAKDKGPVTAMTYLNNATSTWENVDNLNLTYDDEGGAFTGFVLNGKARLPYESEAGRSNGSNNYLYDNLDTMSDWHYGVGERPINSIKGIQGYWQLSSYGLKYSTYVSDSGAHVATSVTDISAGVRPVITLKLQ